jgi:hypothetical protein
MNRFRRNHSRWTLVALGASAALAWSPAAIAQVQPMSIEPGPSPAEDFQTPDSGHIQSRVALIEQDTTSTVTPMVATLQLEDGTRLTVPTPAARVGDRVNANYVAANTGEKVVTMLHIEPEVQAP